MILSAAEQSTFATLFPCALFVIVVGVLLVALVRRFRKPRSVRMHGQKRGNRPGQQWRGR